MTAIAAIQARRFLHIMSAAGAEEPSQSAYADLVDSTTPVACWRLDGNLEDSAGSFDGSIGAGGEAYTTPLPADSDPGQAFNCAGFNWITVAHSASLKPANGTLMAWVKPASVHTAAMISSNSLGAAPGSIALLCNAQGHITTSLVTGGVTTTVDSVDAYYTAGQTVCVHVTWNASGVALWLDGNQIDFDATHTSGLTGNTATFRFGTSHTGSGIIYNGLIDFITLWNRVLTDNEIIDLAQLTPPE